MYLNIEKCFLFYTLFFSWTWKKIVQKEGFNIDAMPSVPFSLENIAYPLPPFFGQTQIS